jgi:hypothetical protein
MSYEHPQLVRKAYPNDTTFHLFLLKIMKLRLLSLALCAMLALGALITSCTNTTTPGTTTQGYHDSSADVVGLNNGTTYQFNITGGASGTKIKGVSSWTNGTVRVFWSRAAGDSNQITVVQNSTTPDAITWAPASRTTGPNPDGTFRIYETADAATGHPSGLILGPITSTLSVGDVSAATTIDLVLATDTSRLPPSLVLVSADDSRSLIKGTPRVADFGQVDFVTGGLAMDYLNASLINIPSGASSAGSFIIPTGTSGRSAVVPIRTADNQYARVEIIPQASNSNALWGNTGVVGTPSNRYYIDVNVTYQTGQHLPYAGRPQVNRHTPSIRRSAGSVILK